MSKKRVLLIGGAGTLGSDILEADIPGYEFFVVDDFLESALIEKEVSKYCDYRKLCVSDFSGMLEVFQDFNPHTALYLSTTLSSNQERALNSNVIGMANTIRAAEETRLPTIIYVQSVLTRNCDTPINLSSQREARDSYSTWKLAGEYLLEAYLGKKICLILASVLSPRLNVGAIPAFVSRIGSGDHIKVSDTYRDYIAPETFLLGLREIIDNGYESGTRILGSGKAISTFNLLRMTATALGSTIDPKKIEIVQPKSSDPKRIILEPSWFSNLQKQPIEIEEKIGEIVGTLSRNRRKVRLHH